MSLKVCVQLSIRYACTCLCFDSAFKGPLSHQLDISVAGVLREPPPTKKKKKKKKKNYQLPHKNNNNNTKTPTYTHLYYPLARKFLNVLIENNEQHEMHKDNNI